MPVNVDLGATDFQFFSSNAKTEWHGGKHIIFSLVVEAFKQAVIVVPENVTSMCVKLSCLIAVSCWYKLLSLTNEPNPKKKRKEQDFICIASKAACGATYSQIQMDHPKPPPGTPWFCTNMLGWRSFYFFGYGIDFKFDRALVDTVKPNYL